MPGRDAPGIEDGEVEQKSSSLLLPVVVSSFSQTAPTYRNVQRTWGQTAPEWVIAVGAAGLEYGWLNDEEGLQDHLLVAKDCLDFSRNGHPSPKNMFCLISAIHEAYLYQYDWFIIVSNTTYLAINRLSSFLAKLDPRKPFYIGNPSHCCSEERSSCICGGSVTHCSMENGVIMSRAALQDLTPRLSWCLQEKSNGASESMENGKEEGVGMERGDIALGCCVKKVLEISCSASILTARVSKLCFFFCLTLFLHK